MKHRTILDRVADLEQRMAVLELKSGIEPPVSTEQAGRTYSTAGAQSSESATPTSLASILLQRGAETAPPVIQVPASIDCFVPDPSSPLQPSSSAAPAAHPPISPPAILPSFEPARAQPGSVQVLHRNTERTVALRETIESKIGGRWYAVIGAFVVIVGLVLFFKLAWERGWLTVPPAFRCIGGAAFGFALLGAGEWVRRKVKPEAAVGLTAAGLGSIYASVFAAYGAFHLLSPAVAFVLLSLTIAIGIGIGVRQRSIVVSILSLIGGYVAPILIGSQGANPWVMPSYLLMLLVVSAGVTAWVGGRLSPLRTVAWVGSILIGTPWALFLRADHGIAVFYFAAIWAVMHAEMIWSSRRKLVVANENGFVPLSVRRAGALALSFTTTAWAVGLSIVMCRTWGVPQWMPAAAGLFACGSCAIVMAGSLRVFVDVPRGDSERLGSGLAVQAGVLLGLTLTLLVSGPVESLSWLGLALGAAVAGKWQRSPWLIIYGVVALIVASLRIWAFELFRGRLTSVVIDFHGLHFSTWTLLLWALAAVWLTFAMLARRTPAPAWRSDAPFDSGWKILADIMLLVGGVGLCLFACVPGTAWAWMPAAAVLVVLVMTVLLLWKSPFKIETGVGRVLGVLVMPAAIAMCTFPLYKTAWWETKGDYTVRVGGVLDSNGSMTGGATFSALMLSPLAVAAAALLSGWTVRRLAGKALMPRTLGLLFTIAAGVVAAGLLAVGVCHESDPFSVVGLLWGLLALASAGVALLPMTRVSSLPMGIVLWALATGGWTFWFIFDQWPTLPGVPLSVLGIWIGLGLVVAALCSASAYAALAGECAASERFEVRQAASAALTAEVLWKGLAFTVFLVATSIEVSRSAAWMVDDEKVRLAAVSIWWGVVAITALVFGFARRRAAIRYIGLGLLGAAAVKLLLIDLASVGGLWRVASFLGIGLAMLGVAVAYQKLSSVFTDRPKPTEPVITEVEPPTSGSSGG